MKNENPLLIWDLGNTIVPYDDGLLIHNMAARCENYPVAQTEIPAYFKRDWDLLQTGGMQDEELHDKLVTGLGFKGDFDDFRHVWCSHIARDPVMEKLVVACAQTHTTVVLSNSTKTHWNYFNAHYPVLKTLDGLYASHLLGVIKPDPEIFHMVLRTVGRKPEDAIFIEDDPAMAAGAEAAGLRKGIVFTGNHRAGYNRLIADLAEQGITLDTLGSRPFGRPLVAHTA